MMNFVEKIGVGVHIFSNAYKKTKGQMLVSVIILLIVTLLFTIGMFLAEHAENSDYSIWDALAWTVVKYVEDPSEIAEPPVSLLGKIIGTLVGVLGIAIFAVPAGLIGSGLIDAMEKEERAEELKKFRRRMQKAFRRSSNLAFRSYLDELPGKGGENFARLNFVPQRVTVAKMQVRQGMEFKDIIDTCREFPEFRLMNLADLVGNEEQTEDRFVVEHFPRNRCYGCCISRKSNVTIVCTSSFDEVGIGWFSYYLAKMGGFNYISKEVEVDYDEIDSFYNLSDEPLYDKKKKSEYTSKDKEALKVLKKKEEHRRLFLEDLDALIHESSSWVIVLTEHLKTSMNECDFHITDVNRKGDSFTVADQTSFAAFLKQFVECMENEFEFKTTLHSKRYLLRNNNIGFKLKKGNPLLNFFVLRPSSELMNFNDRKLVVAYRMAQIISQHFDDNHGITETAVKDLKNTGFGYSENKDVDQFYKKDD